MKLSNLYNTVINEGTSISDDQWQEYFTNQTREANGNLMSTLEGNPNYVFILNKNMVHNECGNPNKCETNSYEFIKSRLGEGELPTHGIADGMGFMSHNSH